jgi:hypothetical protein
MARGNVSHVQLNFGLVSAMTLGRIRISLVLIAALIPAACGGSVSDPTPSSTTATTAVSVAPTTTLGEEDPFAELLAARDASLARLREGRSMPGDAAVLHVTDETLAAALEPDFGALTITAVDGFEPYGYWETIVQSEPVTDGSVMFRDWTGGAIVVEEVLLFGSVESAARAKEQWVDLARQSDVRVRDSGQPDRDLFTVTFDDPDYSCVSQTITSTNIAVVSISLLYDKKACNSRAGYNSGYLAAVVKWYAQGLAGWK